MIGFFCPYCKKALQSPEDQAGTRIDCPKCSLQVRVPAPAHAEVAVTGADISPLVQAASMQTSSAAEASDSWWSRVRRLART